MSFPAFHRVVNCLRELEDFCFRFCLNHMTAVTQTEAFGLLDEDVLKDFIKKAALNNAFRS